MPSPKSARVLRGTILAALIAAGLGAAIVKVSDARRTERSWADSVAYANELQPVLEALDYSRDPIWGEVSEGSAFGAYDRALDQFLRACAPVERGTNGVLNFLMHAAEVRRGVSNDFILRQARAADAFLVEPDVLKSFEALSTGAHLRDAAPDIDWSVPKDDDQTLIDRRVLVLAASARARALAEEGQDVEAARLILDAAQLGLDHFAAPLPIYQGIGLLMLAEVFFPLGGERCELDAFDHEARTVVLRGLTKVLDRMEPSEHLMSGDLVFFVRFAQRFDRLPPGLSVEADGALAHGELVDWLAARRAECQEPATSERYGTLKDTPHHIQDRLRALQLALRLDLEGRADPVLDSEGLPIAGKVTEDTVEVTFHRDRTGPLRRLGVTLKRRGHQ